MKKVNNKRSIILSVTALLLIAVLVVGISFSWSEGGNKGYVNGTEITINSGSSLTMTGNGKTSNEITITTTDLALEEVSSADGRNFFFPTIDNTSADTDSMTFREGTPQDENKKYLSFDFSIKAGDSASDVFLGAGTVVSCTDATVMEALRMALIFNDGKTAPIVFKCNQLPDNTNETYSPISTIAPITGAATQTSVTTKGYGDYYYLGEGSTPIFDLDKAETKNLTLALWLEGTEVSGAYIGNAKIDIDVEFTTNIADLIHYKFVDNCHSRGSGVDPSSNRWISNQETHDGVDYTTMVYIYDDDEDRYYAMKKTVVGTDDGSELPTWEAYVPDTVSNLFFRRYCIDIDTWWNEWGPDMNNIPTVNKTRTFVAISGNGSTSGTMLRRCYGYWKDQYGTYKVYFLLNNSVQWNNLRIYVWDDNNKALTSGNGNVMKEVWYFSDTENTLYSYDLKETDNINGFIIHNNDWVDKIEYDRDWEGYSQYFFNGLAVYKNSNGVGRYLHTDNYDSMIYPARESTHD